MAYIPAENTPMVETVATPETSLRVSITYTSHYTYNPLTSLVPRPCRSENQTCAVRSCFGVLTLEFENRLLDGSDASDPAGGLLGGEGRCGSSGSLCHAAR